MCCDCHQTSLCKELIECVNEQKRERTEFMKTREKRWTISIHIASSFVAQASGRLPAGAQCQKVSAEGTEELSPERRVRSRRWHVRREVRLRRLGLEERGCTRVHHSVLFFLGSRGDAVG